MRFPVSALAVALLVAGALPAAAQFSDSYNFLKAIRGRSSGEDSKKAMDIISKPGSIIIDTRDITTGESALHIVTKARDLPWLNFLLSKGAKPDIKDRQGDTPLMVAANLRFVEGATALIRSHAQVNIANSSGETPLIRAVQLRDPAMVRLLLLAGANPDKTDTMAGLSARDYAKRDTRGAAILKILDEKPAKPAAISGPKL
jgi:uncharacterized protein